MDADVKKMFKQQSQLIKQLASQAAKLEIWLKRHEVRLNEHWKHITK